eukprot:Tbor_TRINITY_DN4734_c0_g1::TRINITY_DN4734_c0_g1_i1::g.17174::m.17174/K03627/MBF1; putative transcription factor
MSQDLKPQVFHFKKKESGGGITKTLTEAERNRLLQQGAQVDIKKKEHLHLNANTQGLGSRAKLIDEDNETFTIKKVDHKMSVLIQKERQAKNMTQADFAKAINEKTSVVTEYESGKAVPVENIILKMEKALGVHLRGVKMGEAMLSKRQIAAAKLNK